MKLAHIFFDASMSNGHKGLTDILFKETKSRLLKEEETAIFINKKFTALKMLTSKHVLLHLKRPDNKPINPETVKYLPHCVNGEELNYSKALDAVIREKFKNYDV